MIYHVGVERLSKHFGIVVAGLIVGGGAGLFAGSMTAPARTCIPTVEMGLDPLLGMLFGVWYAYALTERDDPAVRLWYGAHRMVDTLLGCLVGYHFALGIDIAIGFYSGKSLLPWVSLLMYAASVLGLGTVFFWSTSRWVKRMEHDDPRIFINGKPYDRHLHTPSGNSPE